LRDKIGDAAREVAQANELTPGHGTNSFTRMVQCVFERVEPSIQRRIDTRVSERVEAERSRIASILDADAAAGREETARRLALSSDIAPDKAIEILASTPKAQRTGPTPLDIAMRGQSPNVSDDDGTADFTAEESQTERAANQILNAE
jgi:hypothetical protein